MKIGTLAKRSGLTAHTIRYYERIKLLPYASRASSQHREYDASILSWIDFIGRLKTTGMPIRDMLPRSLEERLICYADQFFSKSTPDRLSVDEVRRRVSRHGTAPLQRFEALHREFGQGVGRPEE